MFRLIWCLTKGAARVTISMTAYVTRSRVAPHGTPYGGFISKIATPARGEEMQPNRVESFIVLNQV